METELRRYIDSRLLQKNNSFEIILEVGYRCQDYKYRIKNLCSVI